MEIIYIPYLETVRTTGSGQSTSSTRKIGKPGKTGLPGCDGAWMKDKRNYLSEKKQSVGGKKRVTNSVPPRISFRGK